MRACWRESRSQWAAIGVFWDKSMVDERILAHEPVALISPQREQRVTNNEQAKVAAYTVGFSSRSTTAAINPARQSGWGSLAAAASISPRVRL